MIKPDETIKLKLVKSKMLLTEVDILMANKFYTTAINRLYYSCFHATKALLLTKDLISKTHSGTVILLNQHFVQNKLFDFEKASFFARLMQERIDDDYSDFMIISEAEVQIFIDPAKEYVAYIEHLIDKYFLQNKY
jgi:uncharacterized protein (UPF0332 family)